MNIRPQDLRGAFVHRVLDGIDSDEPRVYSVKVKSASDRQITLERGFPFRVSGTRFKPDALGRLFFATPDAAIRHYAALQREQIASANRKIIAAVKALAWTRAKIATAVTLMDDAEILAELRTTIEAVEKGADRHG